LLLLLQLQQAAHLCAKYAKQLFLELDQWVWPLRVLRPVRFIR
jgi:hypothetical protein